MTKRDARKDVTSPSSTFGWDYERALMERQPFPNPNSLVRKPSQQSTAAPRLIAKWRAKQNMTMPDPLFFFGVPALMENPLPSPTSNLLVRPPPFLTAPDVSHVHQLYKVRQRT